MARLRAGRLPLSRSVGRRGADDTAPAWTRRTRRWSMIAEVRTDARPVPGWLPRATLSGFIASMAMAFLFFAAYGLARVASNVVLADRRGAETFHQWLQALTNNQVLDLAAGSLYAAAAAHLAVGVLAAILYGYYFEP